MSTLRIRELRASYGRVEVLHGIDADVEAGSIVSVLGPNGAGKTSLLRAISRTIRTTGTIEFGGQDITRRTTSAVAKIGLGHVPEGRGTFPDLTVEENLRIGGISRPRALRAQRREDMGFIYEVFPVLDEFRARPAATLSGGQAQMLAVSRALLARPRLLLVDEPSLGLAPLTVSQLFESFRTLRRRWDLTIVLAEQNARLSLKIADHAIVLARGTVALTGPADRLRDSEEIARSYLGIGDGALPPAAAEGERSAS
jgi:branched-chain amino acid transport system ATP-binding protein